MSKYLLILFALVVCCAMWSCTDNTKKNKKVETSLIEQFEYPKYGPGQLYTLLADSLVKKGVNIVYNSEVNKILLNKHKKL